MTPIVIWSIWLFLSASGNFGSGEINDFESLRGMAIRTIIVPITVISHEHLHWELDYLFNTFASYQKRKHQSVHLFISTTDPTSIKTIPGWSRASWWFRCTCQRVSRRLSSSPLYSSTSFTIGSISSMVKWSEEQHNTTWASWCLNTLAARLFVQQLHQLKVTK